MNMCFAGTFTIGKLGLAYTGPVFLNGIRMLIGGSILLGYYIITTREIPSIQRKDWGLMLKIIIFYDIFALLLEYWAMQYMSSLKTNMLWSSLPFVSAILGYYLFKEQLTKSKVIGLLVGTLGMVPIMLLPDERATAFSNSFLSLPEIAMMVVVFSSAYGAFLAKELFDRGYQFVLINGTMMLAGGCILLPLRLALLPIQPVVYSSFWPVIGYAIALVLMSEIVAYGIYEHLLPTHSVTFLTFSGLLCPIFGAFFSKFIFDETLYYHYYIAFVLISIGLVLFYRDVLLHQDREISQPHNHPTG